jgi:hypothetical protein
MEIDARIMHQIPSTKSQIMTKNPKIKIRKWVGPLEFGAYLEFGI